MVDKRGAILRERRQPKQIVLSGSPASMHQRELLHAMQTVYEQLKADKSNMCIRRRFPDGPASCPDGNEIKSAGIADICIALLTSGAAVAAINAIASVIARSKTVELVIWRGGERIGRIVGSGFGDSAQVERLAAQMIKSDVELRLHVNDRAQVEEARN